MAFTHVLLAILVVIAVVVGETHVVLPLNFIEKNEKLNPGDELYFLPGDYKCDQFTIHDNITYKAADLAYVYCDFVSVPFLNSSLITGFHFISTNVYINPNITTALTASEIILSENIFFDATLYINANGAVVQENIFENSAGRPSLISQQCANCLIEYNNFLGVGGNVIHVENHLNPGKTVIAYNCVLNTTQGPETTTTYTTISAASMRSDVLLQISNNVLAELANGYAVAVSFGGNAVVTENYLDGASNNGSAMVFSGYPATAAAAFLMVSNNTVAGAYSTDLITCNNVQLGDIMDNTFYETVTVNCPSIIASNNTDGGSTIPPTPQCPYLP